MWLSLSLDNKSSVISLAVSCYYKVSCHYVCSKHMQKLLTLYSKKTPFFLKSRCLISLKVATKVKAKQQSTLLWKNSKYVFISSA